MREIKFRIWNGKSFFYASKILFQDDGSLTHIWAWNNGDFSWQPIKNYEIVQYTGLKDKNGKEIYEGDIVKIFTVAGGKFQEEEKPQEIHWWNSGFCRGIKDVQGLPLWWLDKDTQKFEVIGNIYENPELLK